MELMAVAVLVVVVLAAALLLMLVLLIAVPAPKGSFEPIDRPDMERAISEADV